jgi:NADPH:quinone reductase-like Zn-dependent oxidoreductase
MKAVTLDTVNEPVNIKELPIPQPNVGELCVELKASALNHRDVWVQKGRYPGMNLPCVLGSDGAGIVVSTGSESDEKWLGKEVIINPGMFWGDNPDVAGKDFQILGMPHHGTFSNFIVIPTEYVYEKPDHLSFEQAAALPLAGVTAYRAMFTKAGLTQGKRVLITGIGGGVALTALVFAKALGCEVYVTSGSDEKIEKAKSLGADGGINYKQEKWAKVLSKSVGFFDVIIDGAGGEGFAGLIDLAAPAANISIYGGTAGNITGILPPKVFFKQIKIMGTTMGTPTDFEEMLELVKKHKITPVIDEIIPLDDAEQAFRKMDDGKQFGKIVLKH